MTGQELFNICKPHVGEKYVLGAIAPKNDANYKGPWDCAEFTSWAVYQLSGKLYGCANNNGNPASADAYTGFWKRDADKLGKIVSVASAARIPGAAVLRYSGSGLIGHIAFSNGKGGTVEAHSSKTGVVFSTLGGRRWDIGILVPWITYETLAPANVKPVVDKIYRFTDPLMRGKPVRIIQQALRSFGYNLDDDGIFGSKTFYAVRNFQAASGLVPDGEVGPKTAQKLGIAQYI